MCNGVLVPLTRNPLVADVTAVIVQLAVPPLDVVLPETLKARSTTLPGFAVNPLEVAPLSPQTLSEEVMVIPVTLIPGVGGTSKSRTNDATRMSTTNPTRIQSHNLLLGGAVGGGPYGGPP